ncbi:hypothetical protein FRB96_009459 [Tulasnella sp. 330]|nr:hypothetical protein FRB96_009459 [Tulasnella sp. 330]
MIVQAVQDIRSQRQACGGLAEKVAKMVLAMAEELAHGGLNENMQKRIATFSGELKKILTSILQYKDYKWYRHFLEKSSISETVSDGIARLDECARNFQMVGMLDLHKMLESAARTRQETNNYQQAILAQQEDVATTMRSVEKVVRQMSVIVQPVVEEVMASLLLEDLARLSRFRHPNMPVLIGRSARQASSPFAVFKELTLASIRDMFLRCMESSPAEGFMFALSIMQGVASAIHHLSDDLSIGTKDLEACMNIENLVLSGSGKVIVGYGLILSGASTSYNLDLSRWLIRLFWRLTNEILYGNADPIDDQNWDSMQSKLDKHIQPLPTLVAYDCPDFAFITRRLSSILNCLEALRRSSTRELSYADIRRQLIRTPSAHVCFVYRPQTAIDVALGDIGYMNSGCFVKVCNIREDVEFETVLNGNVDYVRSSPPIIQTGTPSGGTIKHTFHNPIYCNIVRQGKSKHIKDISNIWPHFISRAPKIAAGIAGLLAEDLILIANIQNGWRGTRLQCKPEEHFDPTKPFTADFVESLELLEGQNWGTWVVAGIEIKDPLCKLKKQWTMTETGHCIQMEVNRYAQRIEFMQLSRSDFTPIKAHVTEA